MEVTDARRFRGLPTVEVCGLLVPEASNGISRLLGLSLLAPERAGTGLLIPGCRSVHTFGMRFALDLTFVDQAGQIVRTECCVGPGRVLFESAARQVLEVPSVRWSCPPSR